MNSQAMDASFASTQWSIVLEAQGEGPAAFAALSELCTLYWYPVYAYIRRRTQIITDAEDLTQAFFTHLLARGRLAHVDQTRGRYRSYLLACCRNFLENERERMSAQKRGGQAIIHSFDFADADRKYQMEPADPITPEKLFVRRWALDLLARGLSHLETEAKEAGKMELFLRLRPNLVGEPYEGYAKIAADLKMQEGTVRKSAERLRKRYAAILRQQIAATVQSPEEVDAEIRELFAAVSSE